MEANRNDKMHLHRYNNQYLQLTSISPKENAIVTATKTTKTAKLPHRTQPKFGPAFRWSEKGAGGRVVRLVSKQQSTKQ
eukprot:8091818-Ditylum_brightwellii.AAC.1